MSKNKTETEDQQILNTLLTQGAAKDGKTPDGSSYVEAAEKAEIKALLTN